MAAFHYSARTRADLQSIGDYTVRQWGSDQASHYLGQLEECCQRLAAAPAIGRVCDYIRPGLRRMEQGSHVIFYRQQSDGILIVRILHQHMLPGPQLQND